MLCHTNYIFNYLLYELLINIKIILALQFLYNGPSITHFSALFCMLAVNNEAKPVKTEH